MARGSKFNDPQFGPLLSAVILLLALLIAYLVVILPFSQNATAEGGAITGLAVLLGAVIEVRGRTGNRRGK